jgi:hypothetical protein
MYFRAERQNRPRLSDVYVDFERETEHKPAMYIVRISTWIAIIDTTGEHWESVLGAFTTPEYAIEFQTLVRNSFHRQLVEIRKERKV